MNRTFRFAVREDTPLILHFIRELADYERMSDKLAGPDMD